MGEKTVRFSSEQCHTNDHAEIKRIEKHGKARHSKNIIIQFRNFFLNNFILLDQYLKILAHGFGAVLLVVPVFNLAELVNYIARNRFKRKSR